jgi:hypothetical protein
VGDEVEFITCLEANLSFESSIFLELGPAITVSFIHFVVPGPSELHRVAVDSPIDRTGDAAEGELPNPTY